VEWSQIRAALALRPATRVADAVRSRAAVAIILKDGAGGLEALFIRRAESPRDPWSGQVAFPGGRSEPGDADLAATARRETLEEIGLDLSRSAELLGPLDEVRAMARMRPLDLSIMPFVFRLCEAVPTVLSPEVTSLHWLPLGALLDPSAASTFEYMHETVTLRFPSLAVGGLVIWGLTYRMFTGLAERLRDVGAEAAAGAMW
jgi:8-oxo-dGTP pyrophosphatase MutT (NUDIX family)